MKDKNIFAVLRETAYESRYSFLLFLLFSVIDYAVFILYRLPTEPFLYAEILLLSLVVLFTVIRYFQLSKRAELRKKASASLTIDRTCLPKPLTLTEADYQTMITALVGKIEELQTAFHEEKQDMSDYYTTWVHQIKTPIAVMKLQLSGESVPTQAIGAELLRIEQYVDMALAYIRLGSESTDLVVREYSLDEMIRETVRKFAVQFIRKRLKLEYAGTELKIITDKKWFCCILEQLLSNAIKYTANGSVTISVMENQLLISDTGIGIAKEDMPRIFEKGYTGQNGRLHQKSSGLGLYLCRKAADLLALRLGCESKIGEGSTFFVELRTE